MEINNQKISLEFFKNTNYLNVLEFPLLFFWGGGVEFGVFDIIEGGVSALRSDDYRRRRCDDWVHSVSISFFYSLLLAA
jgi:hypothetical protein